MTPEIAKATKEVALLLATLEVWRSAAPEDAS